MCVFYFLFLSYKWFQDFMSLNLSFYVVRGVPQGSVLGPVSFTLTNYDVRFYAGVIVLYCIIVMIV